MNIVDRMLNISNSTETIEKYYQATKEGKNMTHTQLVFHFPKMDKTVKVTQQQKNIMDCIEGVFERKNRDQAYKTLDNIEETFGADSLYFEIAYDYIQACYNEYAFGMTEYFDFTGMYNITYEVIKDTPEHNIEELKEENEELHERIETLENELIEVDDALYLVNSYVDDLKEENEELKEENEQLKSKVLELYNELIRKNENLRTEKNTNIYLNRTVTELRDKLNELTSGPGPM